MTRSTLIVLAAACGGLLLTGCSSAPPPPIEFSFAKTETVTEIGTSSLAIRDNAIVPPDGYTTVPDSGFPPKIAPNSGRLFIAYGTLTVLLPNPSLTSVELIKGGRPVGRFVGVAQPLLSLTDVEGLSSGLTKHLKEDEPPIEEFGFVFGGAKFEFEESDEIEVKITWEKDGVSNSVSIPLRPAET